MLKKVWSYPVDFCIRFRTIRDNPTKHKERREKEGGRKKIVWKIERKKKEKRVGIKYLDKRKYCVGTEPSALVYIGILVTYTTTGHGGSVVSTLTSQVKCMGGGGVSIPGCGNSFYHIFLLSGQLIKQKWTSIWSDIVQ